MTNPLEPLERRHAEATKLVERLAACRATRKRLAAELAEYESFKPQHWNQTIERLKAEEDGKTDELECKAARLACAEGELQSLKKKCVSGLSIVRYFSRVQSGLRANVDKYIIQIDQLKSSIEVLKKERIEVGTEWQRLEERKLQFESVDPSAIKDDQRHTASEEQAIAKELERLNSEIEAINAKVGLDIKHYTETTDQISVLQSDIFAAESLEHELTIADNGYKRAMVHKECDRLFGDSRPARVIRERSSELRSLEANRPKLERKIRTGLAKFERVITHIIIDGNNACYEGRNFIGLRAIYALLKSLVGLYPITVVFDGSIRRLLQADTQTIEEKIGRLASVYVTPTKTAADEYILKLAELDYQSYIVSNDRFVEYSEYNAVATDRIFRFLIAKNSIILLDLDVVAQL